MPRLAFEGLEPCEVKVSRRVLRGLGVSNDPWLPGSRQLFDVCQMSQLSRKDERTKKLMITTLFLNLFLKFGI